MNGAPGLIPSPWRIERGLPFAAVLVLKSGEPGEIPSAADLTGHELAASAKAVADEEAEPDDDEPVLFSFTVEIAEPQTGANTGVATLSLTAEQTEDIADALLAESGIARFDVLHKQPDNSQHTLLRGLVKASRSITEPIA